MAGLPPPPTTGEGFDLYANQRTRLLASGIVLIVLPTIFVGLRLASRRVSRAGYWWDDLLITLALIFSYGCSAIILNSTEKYGLGRHIWVLPPTTPRRFLQQLYAFEMLFYITICFNKLSIIAFYRRIFPISQLRTVLHAAAGVVILFTVICLFIIIFQCVPIHMFWDVQERLLDPSSAKCINVDLLFLVSGGINCFIDFFIVLIPLPLLWRLRTTRFQMAVLTSIFLVAGFVCLVSIIRLVVLGRLTEMDLTWNYTNAAIWTTVEPSMGVVSACLPSLRPLFKRLVSGTYKGPTFRSLTNNSTFKKSFSGADTDTTLRSGSGGGRGTPFSVTRKMWSRNGGHTDSGRADGHHHHNHHHLHSGAGSEDMTDLRSFTRLEELDGPWGHNVHVQGGKETRAKNGPGSWPLNDKSSTGGSEDRLSMEEMGVAHNGGSAEGGAVTFSGGSGSRNSVTPGRHRIKVRTEVTLISTQRLDYRDHLF